MDEEPQPSTSKAVNPSDNLGDDKSKRGDPVIDDRTILVNVRQKENPLIKLLRGVECCFVDTIEADYVFGPGQCALFLSIKYHNLYPTYIYDKFKSVGNGYSLQVLIVMIDVSDPRLPLRELTKFTIAVDATLMVCWSYEEAARYVETYKLYRNKPPEILMEKQGANDRGTQGEYECAVEALASIRKINRTDAVSLISTFASLDKLVKASPDAISVCPGLGPQKAEHLHNLFRKPFKRK